MNPLPPVEHAVWVPLDRDAAFELFTGQLARWWPLASHSCSGDRGADVRFEPRVGGAVTEIAPDGRQHPWGTLTAWDPPAGFAMHWHPAQAPEAATWLRVRFERERQDERDGTRVQVHHSGWSARGDGAAGVREGYHQGWQQVLALFAGAVPRSGDER
jgi:hypothetical protein